MALPGGQSGWRQVQASNARAVSSAQRSRAKSLANQAQLLVSRASVLSSQPPQRKHAGSPETSKTISANFSSYLLAWQRYAHRLRASLRQSSQQLLEARQISDLLNAQLDSMRMLMQEYERQRDDAPAVVAHLNEEIQTLYHRNASHPALIRSDELRSATGS